MSDRLLKRVLDDDESHILLPCELPEREACTVGAALERWRELRARAEAIRPVLQKEDQLMQEILDHGLRGEDRRTLRRLASGSSQEAEEVAARYVAAAIGSEMQALKETLVRNRRELLELSATTLPDRKRDLVVGLDAVRGELQGALDLTREELMAAKDKGDATTLRSMGRSFNDLKLLLQRLEGDRRKLTKNSALAALLVTVCRRVLPVRQIDPSELRDIPASNEGFVRIADFHLFSDASLYDFGEHCSGPNLFTRLKRNVAILHVRDKHGKVVYNTFAVSGELNTPGAPPAPIDGPLRAVEAEDEHGRMFDRHFDAEFKLLSGLCAAIEHECIGAQTDGVEASTATASASSFRRKSSPPRKVRRVEASESAALEQHAPANEDTSSAANLEAQPKQSSADATSSRSSPSQAGCGIAACDCAEARPLEAPRPLDRQLAEGTSTSSGSSRRSNSQAALPLSPAAAAWEGSGRLWSRKSLCRSCAGALKQLLLHFPKLSLDVLVGELDEVWLPPKDEAATTTAAIQGEEPQQS